MGTSAVVVKAASSGVEYENPELLAPSGDMKLGYSYFVLDSVVVEDKATGTRYKFEYREWIEEGRPEEKVFPVSKQPKEPWVWSVATQALTECLIEVKNA